MKSSVQIVSVISLFVAMAGNPSYAKKDFPQVSIEGLERVKDTDLTLVYTDPGAEFSQYNRIFLADTHVAFKKNWQRDQNRTKSQRVTTDEMEKMKMELAGLFHDVFSEVLEQGGYELVTERAEDVLVIKPAIINLDITAPDTMSANRSHSYSESVGEMTLYLELYDSITDDLIAKALDRKVDRKTGYFQWQTRVSNRAAANRILKVWANVLKNGLDEARGINPNISPRRTE